METYQESCILKLFVTLCNQANWCVTLQSQQTSILSNCTILIKAFKVGQVFQGLKCSGTCFNMVVVGGGQSHFLYHEETGSGVGTCPPVFLLFRSVYVFAFLFACVCTHGPRKAKADALLCLTHSDSLSTESRALSTGERSWPAALGILSQPSEH